MSVSAFVVKVPAAEAVVEDLRGRFDATSKLGVPAHITVLFPFMRLEDLTSDVLLQAKDALGAVQSFNFLLKSIGRFPTTTYLAPDPPEPFVALTIALVKQFSMSHPYGGAHEGVIPHLTVAHGDAFHASEAALALEQRLRASEPVRTACSSVTLIENSSGRWKEFYIFNLPMMQ